MTDVVRVAACRTAVGASESRHGGATRAGDGMGFASTCAGRGMDFALVLNVAGP